MSTPTASDIQHHFDQLEDEIQTLASKHNSLVLELGMVWAFIQQSAIDIERKEFCAQRLAALDILIHGTEEMTSFHGTEPLTS
jgi:hypothetical protein